MKIEKELEDFDFIGENHIGTSSDTPMREDAFKLTNEEKMDIIKDDVRHIMETLGLDLTDDSLKGTPNRVAKMFVKEIFGGLDPANKPNAATFENKYKYGEMLVEKNITLYSTCEHHLLPIVGKAHVAYISNGTVVGLSKMNRIVDYYARRTAFGQNLLAETNGFELILSEEDLDGLSEGTIAAAGETAAQKMEEASNDIDKGKYKDKFVFTPHRSSMYPFLTESNRRDLREQLYKSYVQRL